MIRIALRALPVFLFVVIECITTIQAASKENSSFGPLQCNENLSSFACIDFSDLVLDLSNEVEIPCGQCVHMGGVTGDLEFKGGLNVVGRLHFPAGRETSLSITTPYLFVQGELTVDPESTIPAKAMVTIKLSGTDDVSFSRYDDPGDIHNMGKKPVAVVGGRFDVHAMPEACPSWLPLKDVRNANTEMVLPGQTAADCWAVGAEIAISGPRQQLQIVSITVNEDGDSILTFNTAINFDGTLEQDARFADEVALLSRNFKLTSVSDDEDFHGGHLIIYHTPAPVEQFLEGIQIEFFGQQGKVGRYPFHFHMSNSAEGSKISKNIVLNSHQRGFVVHGTHDVKLEENVAFGVHGICYMLEDGSEENNYFIRNIGMNIKIPDTVIDQESDSRPSTFWISNPHNHYIENVASGVEGLGFGYWMDLLPTVRGASLSSGLYDNVNPTTRPLLTFDGNVAKKCPFGFSTYPSSRYLPSGGMQIMKNWRLHSNQIGALVQGPRHIKLDGGVFGGNNIQVDFDRCEDCELVNADIIGRWKGIANFKGCRQTHGRWTTAGISLMKCDSPCSGMWAQHFANLTFSHFEDEGICTAAPIDVIHWKKGLFDIRKTWSNIQFDQISYPKRFPNMCELEKLGGTRTYGLYDEDGSFTETPGYLVTNLPELTTFPSQECEIFPDDCAALCPSTCLRSLIVTISYQKDEDIYLTLSDESNKEIVVASYDRNGDKSLFHLVLPAETQYIGYFSKSEVSFEGFSYIDGGGNCMKDLSLTIVDPPPPTLPPTKEHSFCLNSKNSGSLQTCKWLGLRKEMKRHQICTLSKYNRSCQGYEPASVVCDDICSSYPCRPDKKKKFIWKNKPVVKKNCTWLKGQNEKKKKKACSSNFSPSASKVCLTTCCED